MPPKKTDTSQKDVLADCIAVLMATGGSTSISRAQYDMMSSINGERTASSFEHQFRHIIAKSKELKQRLQDGDEFPPVPPGKKGGAASGPATPATPNKRKPADNNSETPTKKPKATPRKKKTATPEEDGKDDFQAEGLPVDAREFIKAEETWEKEFV
ncbi:hypothetical protein NX059_004115 [Plenodomus lindquistii]|nr:hypothetical protein NX059_004115 [Plenodomus lindquistii]